MKRYGVLFLVVFLVGITLFSVFRFITVQRQNYVLSEHLDQMSLQVNTLEDQRKQLHEAAQKQDQENRALRERLQANQLRLAKMEEDFNQAQKAIENLQSEISLVKAENATIRQEEERIKTQLAETSQEKEALRVRLGSLAGLRQAIRELKIKMSQDKINLQKEINVKMLLEGNRGYIVRYGKSTHPAGIRIEVNPAR